MHGFDAYLCSMRWFVVLFTGWILFISCVPCADELGACEDEETACQQADHPEDEKHSAELCSPFCACACCTNLIIIDFYIPLQKLNIVSVLNSFYDASPFSEFIYRHWQPPKGSGDYVTRGLGDEERKSL